MTVIYNDPAEFAEEQLEGFTRLYADRLQPVVGGVVGHRRLEPQVAVVVGGGSGHYPAFAGLVGPGFATGAVVGNIFTSPSAAHAYSVGKAADEGRGVIFTFGNYAGDVMNFGIAAKRLRAEGIDARIQLVTDDVASGEDESVRRGIAGDFVVFKCMGAAAAKGWDIDEVQRAGELANSRTRSFGVAFSGCTMPGGKEPLFTVPEGSMSLGLGIHGEPGIEDVPALSAKELAGILVNKVVAEAPKDGGKRVAAILNGLGTTKYEELFLLWGFVAKRLEAEGFEIIEPEVGELVTSLDMGGCSLTLTWLDDELEDLWRAPAYAAAYRKDSLALDGLRPSHLAEAASARAEIPEASAASLKLARALRAGLEAAKDAVDKSQDYLGELDSVAGDGDHGRGMIRGVTAACEAVKSCEAGAAWTLTQAGRAWATKAGGTSGVLWGAALEAAGDSLTDKAESYDAEAAVKAVDAFVEAISELGGAEVGDKTLVDALVPFKRTLAKLAPQRPLQEAWAQSVVEAEEGAQKTASLSAKKGRARPLAAKSVGSPDPGAVSFAIIARAFGDALFAGLDSAEGTVPCPK